MITIPDSIWDGQLISGRRYIFFDKQSGKGMFYIKIQKINDLKSSILQKMLSERKFQ